MPPVSPGPLSRWYFVHPWVDALGAGGLSILVFVAAMASPWSSSAGPAFPSALQLAVWVQWIINWPHFSATSYRLLRVPENRREFPLTTYVIPVVIGGGVLAALHWPTFVAPYFIKFFLLWSPYHFTAQSLGISLLYARRAGYTMSSGERWALTIFLFGTFIASTARAETSSAAQGYFGIAYPGLGVPWELAFALSVLMYAAGVRFLLLAYQRWTRNGERLPLIVLIVAAAQYVWFILGSHAPSFYVFVPAFHALQYLLIAWVMELRENRSGRSAGQITTIWAVANFLGGVVLFWGAPRALTAFGVSLEIATAVLIAGVQIHHFFVDGVIWKLRNPRVANPLTVGWGLTAPVAQKTA
jgi:hypothetical protein